VRYVTSSSSSSSSSSGNNHKDFVITDTRKDQYGLAKDIVFESVKPYVDTVTFLTDARNFIFKTLEPFLRQGPMDFFQPMT